MVAYGKSSSSSSLPGCSLDEQRHFPISALCSTLVSSTLVRMRSRSSNDFVCALFPNFRALLFMIMLINGHNVADSDENVYQPAQSEIDHFKMVQERTEMQQLRPKVAATALQVIYRHPFLSHLLNHLTAQQALHQELPPRIVPIIQKRQQLAMTPEAHLPALPQFPQVTFANQQLAVDHNLRRQFDPLSSLHSAPTINADTYRTLMHKNMPLAGELPGEIETKLVDDNKDEQQQQQIEKKSSDGALGELADADRDEKHHGRGEGRSLNGPRRCFACSWSIAHCSDFNCYNNPDICSNNHFNPHIVQVAECPSGCEQYVVTDPNGLITTWKRGCSPPTLPIRGTRCNSHYELGIRIDRCICSHDWCNWASSIHRVSLSLLTVAICLNFMLSRLFHF